jgi:glyoxylase-like metal-dependent hydrolase (beta-lactamase superfamily II)
MQGPQAEELLGSMRDSQPDRYASVSWSPPTVLLEGQARVDAGDLSLELIPTPGHTPDHYALWLPELDLLLAGDAAELPFPLVSEDGSLVELRASLRRMAALNPSTVLYCHAPGITSPDLLSANSRYFDELERRCRERGPDLLDAEHPAEALGWPADEIIARLAPTMGPEDVAFYRRFHDANIRAAARALVGS